MRSLRLAPVAAAEEGEALPYGVTAGLHWATGYARRMSFPWAINAHRMKTSMAITVIAHSG